MEDSNELQPEDFRFVKRPSVRPPSRPNEIYVTRKSQLQSQLQRAKDLLQISSSSVGKGYNEIIIHGLGAAIPRAIELAQNLIRNGGGDKVLGMWPTTSSVPLIDDFEPLTEEGLPHSQVRFNSAIHIRVYRKVPLVTK